jgi:secreted protein with Ig-like and vWFA domain
MQPNDTYFYPEKRDPSDPSKLLDTSQKGLRDNGFNILVTYGPYNEKEGVKVAGSALSIVGIQLTGVHQVIGGDGSPIQEQYDFIARDLNGRIN